MRKMFFLGLLLITNTFCSGTLEKLQKAIKSQDQNLVNQALQELGQISLDEKRIAMKIAKEAFNEVKEKFFAKLMNQSLQLLGWMVIIGVAGLAIKYQRYLIPLGPVRYLAVFAAIWSIVTALLAIVITAYVLVKTHTSGMNALDKAKRIRKMITNRHLANFVQSQNGKDEL